MIESRDWVYAQLDSLALVRPEPKPGDTACDIRTFSNGEALDTFASVTNEGLVTFDWPAIEAAAQRAEPEAYTIVGMARILLAAREAGRT